MLEPVLKLRMIVIPLQEQTFQATKYMVWRISGPSLEAQTEGGGIKSSSNLLLSGTEETSAYVD